MEHEAGEADGGEDEGEIGWAAAAIFLLLVVPHFDDGVLDEVFGVFFGFSPASGKQEQSRAVFGQPLFPFLGKTSHASLIQCLLRRGLSAKNQGFEECLVEEADFSWEGEFADGHGGVLFIGASGVDGGVRGDFVGGHDVVFEHPFFDFLAADVWEHGSVDFDAGGEGLAAALFHFPAECGVFDDVLFFVGEVVFAHDGADAFAPSAEGFEVGGDGWFCFVHDGGIIGVEGGFATCIARGRDSDPARGGTAEVLFLKERSDVG